MDKPCKADAIRLRIEWLQLLGHNHDVIQTSLRSDPPQSVVEEQYLLESVKNLIAAEDAVMLNQRRRI